MQPCNADLSKIEYPCHAQRKWDGLKLIVEGTVPNLNYRGRSMKLIKNEWVKEHFDEKFAHMSGQYIHLSGELQAGHCLDDCDGMFSAHHREFDIIKYHVFDDLRQPDLLRAYRNINAQFIINEINDPEIVFCDVYTFDSEDELLEFHVKNEADPRTDGTVVIRLDLSFKSGKRTVNEGYCVKIKDFKDIEARIVGFNQYFENTNPRVYNKETGKYERSTAKEGMVPHELLGSFICELNGKTFSVGSGLNDKTRKEYWNSREELEHTLIKMKYQRITKKGVPLLPVFLALRDEIDMPEPT